MLFRQLLNAPDSAVAASLAIVKHNASAKSGDANHAYASHPYSQPSSYPDDVKL